MDKWFQDLVIVQELLVQLDGHQADLDGITNADIDVVKNTPGVTEALISLEQSLGALAIKLKATRIVFELDIP